MQLSPKIKELFPILSQTIHGHSLVYLDSAATSQKPKQVIEAIRHYYEYDNSNVHRGVHALAARATEAYEESREKVRQFIRASSIEEIIFTKGTTSAINLVATSYLLPMCKEEDEILITPMEHHSNLIPWQQVAQRTKAVLRYIPLNIDGTLNLNEAKKMITKRTKFVALTHASNVLGVINPVQEITQWAHEQGAAVLIDGAQSAPHMPVDVQALDCDFYVFSGHKMCGPTGIGVLFGKKKWLEQMEPIEFGGEMIQEVDWQHSSWKDLPWKLEAGTPLISEAIGLGVAINFLEQIGLQNIHHYENELTNLLISGMKEVEGITIYGPLEDRVGLVSFNVEGVHPHDLATALDMKGIAIRAGNHCCQPLHKWLQVPASARVSLYLYNQPEEIEYFVKSLKEVKEYFYHAIG